MRRFGSVREWAIATGLLAAAFGASRMSSAYIAAAFPDRPTPRDLLFELLPYAAWPQYITDAAVILGVVLLITYLVRHHPSRLPEAVSMYAVMQLARAAMITFTPLAGPLGNGAYYGFVRVTQHGEVPSGHAATVLLLYLLVDRQEAPALSNVMLALAATEWAALLVSHGHYSIDIVAGLLLATALFRFWDNRAKPGRLRREAAR